MDKMVRRRESKGMTFPPKCDWTKPPTSKLEETDDRRDKRKPRTIASKNCGACQLCKGFGLAFVPSETCRASQQSVWVGGAP